MNRINDNDLDRMIKESKEVIAKSNKDNAKEIYQFSAKKIEVRETEKKGFFSNVRILRLSSLVLMSAFIFVLVLSIVFYNNKTTYVTKVNYNGDNQGTVITDNDDKEVKSSKFSKNVSSLDELKEIISSSDSTIARDYESVAGISIDGYSSFGKTFAVDESQLADSNKISISSTYKTNTREEDVDEADVIKVNGDYIYYIPSTINSNNTDRTKSLIYNYVYILKTDDGKIETVKKIGYGENVEKIKENDEVALYHSSTSTPIDLYYTDKYLIIRLNVSEYDFGAIKDTDTTTYSRYRYYNYSNATKIEVYDLDNYELVTSIDTAGSNLSTRLIDNDLYVINQKTVANDDFLPVIRIDGITLDTPLNRIYFCPGFSKLCSFYVAIYKINLGKEINVKDYYFLSPSVNQIYVTSDTIYLIKNYGSKSFDEVDESDKNGETIIRKTYTINTILPISIKDEIYAESYIEVKGNIDDEYWIDEYDGYLRVASTGTSSSYKMLDKYIYGTSKSEIFNYLTIFKKNEDGEWVEYSAITKGLGEEGERIKSARFEKDVATIVTFRQTDPLYYVDLSDPLNPVITSELKVSGFSVYQHPYKDDYVIGFGYETNESGSTIGIKVALYDISDKYNVTQVGNSIVFLNSSESINGKNNYVNYSTGVLINPKELMLRLDEDLFGFGLYKSSRYYFDNGYKYGYENLYVVLRINLNCKTPLSIYFEESTSLKESSYYYRRSYDRMVFVGDYYYLLTNECVYSYINTSEGFKGVDKNKLN
ncbi:MAG: beta-propeller domain-containing protein [Bacilli bacterium]|nr:beta-propeller domain-containing protein [Bacilli bacterium]